MQTLRKFLPFLFAVAAFLACVLACRPGFSPDGRRIVFSIFDEASKTTKVCIYDRETGKTTTLRTLEWSPGSNAVYCAASWSPSGVQVGLLSTRDKGTNGVVEIIDAQSGRQIRSAPVPQHDAAITLYPPAFTKSFLLFGGEVLTRFNLRNGQVDYENIETNADRGEIYILNNENGVHYYAEARHHDGTNDVTKIEFGTIDPDRLARVPEQTIATEIDGLPDFSPDGKRIALWKKTPSPTVQIWFRSKLEKPIPLLYTNTMVLGNLAWSKDGKAIFAPAFDEPTQPSTETKAMLSLLEIPLDRSPVRRFELGSLKSKPDEAMSTCQIALSPDGKALALGTPLRSLDKTSQPTALYLIDLSDPKRTVKSIPFGTETTK